MTDSKIEHSGKQSLLARIETILLDWAFSNNRGEGYWHSGPIKVCARIMYIMLKEGQRADVLLRASALTYTIVLSMVPVLAMSTAVLKGIGSGDQLRIAAERFIEQVEPRAGSIDTQGQSGASSQSGEAYEQSLSGHLYTAIDTIFNYVDRTNFAALGIIGVISTLIVVILLFSTVEDALNKIWNVQRGRPIVRKIMDYLALLILLPISINLALAGEAVLASDNIMDKLYAVLPFPWLATALLKVLPFIFVTLTLLLMYLFFSRAQVSTKAAIIGAFFAAFFWFSIQQFYIFLQLGVARYNAIYGSFATIPLFLMWVQIGWTFILLGATLTYAVQNQQTYQAKTLPTTPQRQLQLAYDLILLIGRDHNNRSTSSISSLAKRLSSFRLQEIEHVLATLVQNNLLLVTVDEQKEQCFLPVTRVENISLDEIFYAIIGNESIDTPGAHLARVALESASSTIRQNRLEP